MRKEEEEEASCLSFHYAIAIYRTVRYVVVDM